MISKTRKTKLTKSRSRKNPEGIAKEFNQFINEKDKEKKYKIAKSLRKQLSDDKANYWKITREHTNYRDPIINELITKAILAVEKPTKRSNPVKTMFRDTEVVIKHKGNKIIFDEEDADVIKNLIRKQYSDNDDVKDILK
jgi:hypothetical protein